MGPVVAFCMPERSHLGRLLPLVAALSARGIETIVYTDGSYREEVERAGGRLVDLFAKYPLEAADATSRPVPLRYVTFAAHYAAPLIDEVGRLRPSLVVYDSFAVIGYVVGRQLGVAYVNVCAGHNMSPRRALAIQSARPQIAPSQECRRAVGLLATRWGVVDASPFSYFTCLSPFLNLYCEPSPFLRREEAAEFEPVAFFGSLSGSNPGEEVEEMSWGGKNDFSPAVRLYVSFGSVVWRYHQEEALRALGTLADAVDELPRVRAIFSLGGHLLERALRARLHRERVRVANFVDQRRVLAEASVFVTHHGLNSTHEAIFERVPMISYPFFGDQPDLARRCQEFGLAVPLAETARAPFSVADVRTAIDRVVREGPAMAAALDRAHRWEVETMAGRAAVVDRLLSFAR